MPASVTCEPARSVFIAVPSYDYKVDVDVVTSIFSGISELSKHGMNVTLCFASGNCYIDEARNTLTRKFLESGFTDLLFIDTDVISGPDVMARLLLSTHPVCGAIYPRKDPKPELEWPIKFALPDMDLKVPENQSTDSQGFLEALLLPTGMLRINRAVFDEMKAQVKTDVYLEPDGTECLRFWELDVDVQRKRRWGEDFLFCLKWHNIGGKCMMLADANLGHAGRWVWRGNWLEDRARQGHVKQND